MKPICSQAPGDRTAALGVGACDRAVQQFFLPWDERDPANLEVCLRLEKVGEQWTLQEPKQLSEN